MHKTGSKKHLRRLLLFIADCFWLSMAVALFHTFINGKFTVVNFGGLFFGIGIILLIIGNNTIVRHYDKYFRDKIINYPLIDVMFLNFSIYSNRTLIKCRSFRLINCYVWPILGQQRYKTNKFLKDLFDDFDFKQHVTIFERVFVYLLLITILMFAVIAFVYAYQVIVK